MAGGASVTALAELKTSTLVDVAACIYHRPGQRDPEHAGWLRTRLDDARLIADPCPICFPEEERDER